MVTIKNDIESSGSFIPTTQQDKDVNLRDQGAKPPRRRSYRCTAIVLIVILLLMALGVGSVLYFGPAVNRIPASQVKDGLPSSTPRTILAVTEEPSPPPPSVPPAFADPFDSTSNASRTDVNPPGDDDNDGDEEIDIDGPMLVTTTIPTTTKQSVLWIDESNGDSGSASEDDEYYSEEYGSGSGSGELRDSSGEQ